MADTGRINLFVRVLFGSHDRRAETATTNDLIGEAETTRAELSRITTRLSEHVVALKTLARAYANHHHEPQEGAERGRAEAPDA